MDRETRSLVESMTLIGVLCLPLAGASYLAAATQPGPAPVPAAEALARLKKGNERFVRGRHLRVNMLAQRRVLVQQGQHPYAVVLSCSDSRVPPELLFDESLGQLFVVRVAGNVADPATVGSLEYAAEHLRVRLLLVLGHDECGAVKAAAAHEQPDSQVWSIIERIMPAVEAAESRGMNPPDTLAAAIQGNVGLQLRAALSQSPTLQELARDGVLEARGGIYRLRTGKVEFLEAAGTQ